MELRHRRVADAMVTRPKIHPPHASPQDLLALFENDHVHMALVVEPDGRLITCIERSDLDGLRTLPQTIASIGTLDDRTVGPLDPLEPVMQSMLSADKRRLAVVDETGRLLGLLCLKWKRTGFCSDQGVRSRAIERGELATLPTLTSG